MYSVEFCTLTVVCSWGQRLGQRKNLEVLCCSTKGWPRAISWFILSVDIYWVLIGTRSQFKRPQITNNLSSKIISFYKVGQMPNLLARHACTITTTQFSYMWQLFLPGHVMKSSYSKASNLYDSKQTRRTQEKWMWQVNIHTNNRNLKSRYFFYYS